MNLLQGDFILAGESCRGASGRLLATRCVVDYRPRSNSPESEVLFSRSDWPKMALVAGLMAIGISVAVSSGGSDRPPPVDAIKVRVPLGEIASVAFDELEGTLKIGYQNNKTVNINVDSNIDSPQVLVLSPPTGAPDTLRFLSKRFYASLGQENDGLFVLSRDILPGEIQSDPNNRFAAALTSVVPETPVDASLIAIKGLTNRYNIIKTDRPLCTSGDARELVRGVRAGSCYVACSGLSIIADQLVPAPSRVVLLHSRTDNLDGKLRFLWSEWHTTLEVLSGERWYVADPTYGFVYVKNSEGKRLSTAELIEAIADEKEKELKFGVLSDDDIREVPGDVMLKEQPTLAALYYTPDKKPTYLPISQPGAPVASAKVD